MLRLLVPLCLSACASAAIPTVSAASCTSPVGRVIPRTQAPDFTANSVVDGKFDTFTLSDYLGKVSCLPGTLRCPHPSLQEPTFQLTPWPFFLVFLLLALRSGWFSSFTRLTSRLCARRRFLHKTSRRLGVPTRDLADLSSVARAVSDQCPAAAADNT